MRRTIMLRGKTKHERYQHEADGSLLLWRKNKNFSPELFGGLLFHLALGLTCRDRYLPRTFL